MGKTLEMRMARASADDFTALIAFFGMLDEVMEYGTYTPPDDENEEVSQDVDEERLAELIFEMWPRVGVSWNRVVFGGQMAIDQLTDPNLSYLAVRPDIGRAMQAAGVEVEAEGVVTPQRKGVVAVPRQGSVTRHDMRPALPAVRLTVAELTAIAFGGQVITAFCVIEKAETSLAEAYRDTLRAADQIRVAGAAMAGVEPVGYENNGAARERLRRVSAGEPLAEVYPAPGENESIARAGDDGDKLPGG